MSNKTKRISSYGMLLALAVVLGYVEAIIPINIGIPGVKMGIPNIVTVVSLYTIGAAPAFVIALLRILIIATLFGNMMTLAYSLCGFALSFLSMLLLRKPGGFSRTSVSITGGVMHNVGQLVCAVFLLKASILYMYFPVLLAAGIAAGLVIGLLSSLLVDRIGRYLSGRSL